MEDRTLTVRTLHGPITTRSITGGVSQSSVLRPILWNVFYDDLLRVEVPEGVQFLSFADDIAVLAVARTAQGLEAVVNPTLATINEWMVRHGLELAHSKTEAIMLTKKWAFSYPVFSIGGHSIKVKR